MTDTKELNLEKWELLSCDKKVKRKVKKHSKVKSRKTEAAHTGSLGMSETICKVNMEVLGASRKWKRK